MLREALKSKETLLPIVPKGIPYLKRGLARRLLLPCLPWPEDSMLSSKRFLTSMNVLAKSTPSLPFRCHITDLPAIPTYAGNEFILPHAHPITSYLRVNLSLAKKAVNGPISQVVARLN
jgi:hypothetical protein